MSRETARELIKFIEKSPTGFHAVKTMEDILDREGYIKLEEGERWELVPQEKYYTTRNGSALIAFTLPAEELKGFRIIASHSDSPSFKIKENPEILVENQYVKLNTEGYGGMICAPWLDRPLSVAGRIAVKENGKIATRLVNIDRDLLLIPNLAIHMNRDVNNGYKYNPQKDLLPLFGEAASKGKFQTILAEAAGVREEDILGHDLFLYNRQKGTIWGADEEFVSIGRLDDLQCAFASLKGFLEGPKEKYGAVHCVMDNEEVGSGTKQGAASTFLYDVLLRIQLGLEGNYEDYLRCMAGSFMISADNAHGVHPNYTEKADPVNRPYLNKGIVIKYSANQKYCTDGFSAAVFKDVCSRAGVPFQTFTNRSDMPGGSTLGNISMSQVSVNAVDIGLPQLAMHSPYETAGVEDTDYFIRAAKVFFE